MKRLTSIITGIVFLCGLMTVNAQARGKKGIYYELSDMPRVRTYIEDVNNTSDNDKVDLTGLKKTLENALAARMTINFAIVSNKKDADVIINFDVVEFLWTDKDPIDSITGIGAIAMDAAIQENYGRIQAEVSVIKAKDQKVMWKRKIKATITDKNMSEGESVDLLNKRLVKMFMKECLSKRASSEKRR